MSTFKKNGNWYVGFRFNRTRYRKKSPENSLAGAKVYEAILRKRVAQGENIFDYKSEEKKIVPTFLTFSSEWMEEYAKANNKQSEYNNKESMLRINLIPHFGNLCLDQISNRNIEEYKAKKINAGLSPKTINNHLTVLRKCLGTAQEWEIIKNIPRIKMLRVDPPKTTYLTTDEYTKLLNKAEGIWYEMIYVALNTGLRFGELTALKWCDIDFERKVLTVQRALYRNILGTTKSNKVRKIPLTDNVLKIFSLARKTANYIFCHKDGSTLTHSSCRKKIKEIAKLARIKNICWHDLRHAFASNLANKGVAIQQIQALLGHTDIKTSMRYSHISSASLVEAINKLQPNIYIGPSMAPEEIKVLKHQGKKATILLPQTA